MSHLHPGSVCTLASLRACGLANLQLSCCREWPWGKFPHMAHIVSIAGQKGGAGKSTLAVHLAEEWHTRGHRVLLVDADPQGTAQTWADVADEAGADRPAVVAMGDGIRRDLANVAESYDIVVVDLPGRAAKRQIGALMLSDLVLLPSGPGTADIWALAASAEMVNEVSELRPDLRAAVVLNRRANNTESKQARDSISAVGLTTLGASLGQRVAFSEALAAGKGIGRYAAGTTAAYEFRKLVDEAEDLLGFVQEANDVA